VRLSFSFTLIVSGLIAACGGDSSGPGTAGPPSGLTAVNGTLEGQAGLVLATPLSAKVVDAQNRPVANVRVNFIIAQGAGSLSAAADTTDTQGIASVNWTLGTALGSARAEARVQGVLVPAVFNVDIKSGPAASVQRTSNPIGSSAGGFNVADSVTIKVADQFGNAVAGAPVNFSVLAGGGSVTPANATTRADGTARVMWQLGTAGEQRMRANTGAIETLIDATAMQCAETQIAVGAVMTFGPADPRCVVLNGTAQRYLVTVVNAAPTVASANSFRLRGAGAGTAANSGDVATRTTSSLNIASAAASAALQEELDRAEAHDQIMRANENLMRTLLPGLRSAVARKSPSIMRSVVAAPPPNVGDIISLYVPRLTNLCGGDSVAARVVFVGQHGVVLEDMAAPMAGQADTLFVRVGQEFDTNMWNILNENFGNPLAMDTASWMDQNQRFFMLFSKKVNDTGLGGFVSSGDFFPRAGCATSNQAEIFYAGVPEITASSSSNTPEKALSSWYRTTRTIIIHEVKHIVSFAERFARPAFTPTSAFSQADRWLEESSAMIAEELWGRATLGYAPRANINYRNSIYCEVRANAASFPDCPEPYKPSNITAHFAEFYNYLAAAEGHSPIGAIDADDYSFYGSGWSFLRWIIDTHIGSESAFLKGMTNEIILPGVQNVEARTGRSFVELVNDWAVAMVLDDYPGFTPVSAKYSFPSWNTRDIFAGLNQDFSSQGFFTRAVPVQPRAAAFGNFSIDVSSVRGGGMAVFEMAGTQSQRQMIEFNGFAGTAFPAEMRVNIIRVQ
jgi:hypothetical protein